MPEVVLLEMNLPKIDRLGVLRRMRADEFRIANDGLSSTGGLTLVRFLTLSVLQPAAEIDLLFLFDQGAQEDLNERQKAAWRTVVEE